MQTGTVTKINPTRGMFIVAINGGDYAVFELLDSIDLAIGDQLQGNLNALGSEELLHLGQRCNFSVFGQSGPSSLTACQRLL